MRPLAHFSSLALALSLMGASPVFADDGACRNFKWDLAREQAWFQASPPSLTSGATLAKTEGAAALQLSPVDGLAFVVAPEHKPAVATFGAIISTPALDKPAVYQVTLSDEGWIDVIQDGTTIRSGAFSGQKGCPGLRKSVRFDLKPGPVTIQISGVKAQTINVALGPAD